MEFEGEKAQTRATYNLAADHFDAAPLALWEHAGRRTVELLTLEPGNKVLDICCGSGSTALPAAREGGEFGTVLGVDLAEGLLELAARKAAVEGLRNVQFRQADFERMTFPANSCEAVVCQFGVFFLDDMAGAVRRMWTFVAPGGCLAVTTWGARVLEPVSTYFRDRLRQTRPELLRDSPMVDRVSTPEGLRSLFGEAGVTELDIVEEESLLPLEDPHDYWLSLLGSGSRRIVEALGAAEAAGVRDDVAAYVEREHLTQLHSDILYAVARKPAP
ncbi:MAG: class I SAM-dependent methyltransferase [Candidatus Dormibacteria bacterium]